MSSSISSPLTLVTNPDAPVSLVENTSLRSFTSLSFVWADGMNNYGSSIIDYTIWIASGVSSNATFTVYAQHILQKSYTVTNLVPGNMY